MEPDEDRRDELFFQILDIWAEEVPMVTMLGMDRRSILVKNGLKNNGGEDMPFFGTVDDSGYAPTLFWE